MWSGFLPGGFKHDDGRGNMNDDLKEGVHVLPMRRGDLTAPGEEKWYATPSGDAKREPLSVANRISRESLV